MTYSEALALLDLHQQFTPDDLRKAYREALMVWHPDRFQGHALLTKAERKSKQINDAFQVLLKARENNPTISAPVSQARAGTSQEHQAISPSSWVVPVTNGLAITACVILLWGLKRLTIDSDTEHLLSGGRIAMNASGMLLIVWLIRRRAY